MKAAEKSALPATHEAIAEGAGGIPARNAPPALPLAPSRSASPLGGDGPPGRAYAYKKPWVRKLFGTVDAAGERYLRRDRPRPRVFERVLLMRPDHLGDVLFALPAVQALRRCLPDARIDLLIGQWARPLFNRQRKELAGAEILEFEAPWLMRPKRIRFGLPATLRLARLLRQRDAELGGPYDLAIDLRGDFQLILAARMAGVRYLVGRGITGLGFALDAEAEEVAGRHQVEGNLALLEKAGFGPLETVNPRLELSKEEVQAGQALLRDHGVDPAKLVIGIHPGAGLPTKRWGADKFAHLIERLLSDLPARVVLLGGPDDRPVVDRVRAGIGEGAKRVVDLCGKLPSLRAFMAVARACRIYVGNDSGPSHIAAALGLPVICVFSGTNDPAEWGPRGSIVVVIRKRIECEGCGLSFCDHHSCMVQLDVETVYQAVRRCV